MPAPTLLPALLVLVAVSAPAAGADAAARVLRTVHLMDPGEAFLPPRSLPQGCCEPQFVSLVSILRGGQQAPARRRSRRLPAETSPPLEIRRPCRASPHQP